MMLVMMTHSPACQVTCPIEVARLHGKVPSEPCRWSPVSPLGLAESSDLGSRRNLESMKFSKGKQQKSPQNQLSIVGLHVNVQKMQTSPFFNKKHDEISFSLSHDWNGCEYMDLIDVPGLL